jgi:hypothetical protein
VASRLVVAAVVVLVLVAGADAILHRGGEPAPSQAPPPARGLVFEQPTPGPAVAELLRQPSCTTTRRRSLVLVECDDRTGLATYQITTEMRP